MRRALINLRQRMVALYKSGPPDLTTVIFSARGFDQLATSGEYLTQIQDQGEAAVSRVRVLRDQARRTVRLLRATKLVIESARDAIAAREQQLRKAAAAVEGEQNQLLAARAERQRALHRLEDQEQSLVEDVSALQAQIAEQLNGASSSGALPAGPVEGQSSSGLIWPVQGIVTSGFGARWGGFHEGLDIAAPEGTPIVAAGSGTVVIAAYTGGYGNYTCIDHGGGLSTCYGHQSAFAVSSGESVSQGEVIGYVGSTGHSTGPHLHFEVRVDGAAQDPLGYL